eukprot:SAG31_NODE_1138_length_9726_cov_11.750493_10_plen_401_part_00
MIQKIKERIFPFLIAISALSVSASAAFYSVSGLSKLFAGAAFAVIVMAASLEVAKLVIASLLYQYRKSLPFLLKFYLSVACFVLILITSMGIYGFLSAAYQETSAKAGSIDSQITLIETKRNNVREQLTVYNAEKSTINGAISDLRTGLSNNKIQYTNAEGVVITTTSSSTRKSLERQLDQAIERQSQINSKVDTLNQRLFDYETEIVEVSTNNDIAGELGPLKYLSGLTGIPMDNIINYLLLIIIFVFDPLAISLVIAANFAFEQLNKNKKEEEMKIFSWFKKKKKDTFEDLDVNLNDGLENEPILEEEIIEEVKPEEEPIEEKPIEEEPIEEEVIEPIITEEQMDVDKDGDIDEKDAKRIEDILSNPNLPSYKRNYWNVILLQIKKRIRDKDNSITYN